MASPWSKATSSRRRSPTRTRLVGGTTPTAKRTPTSVPGSVAGGPGGAHERVVRNGTFAMQATWSNETSSCVLTRQPQVLRRLRAVARASDCNRGRGCGRGDDGQNHGHRGPFANPRTPCGRDSSGFAAAFSSNIGRNRRQRELRRVHLVGDAGRDLSDPDPRGRTDAAHSVYFWLTVTGPPTPTLTNGVWAGGITGAAGAQQFWQINVPAGQTSLQVRTINGSGNADLYVRAGGSRRPRRTPAVRSRPATPRRARSATRLRAPISSWSTARLRITGVQLRSLYTSTLTNPLSNGVSVGWSRRRHGNEPVLEAQRAGGQDQGRVHDNGRARRRRPLYSPRLPTDDARLQMPIQDAREQRICSVDLPNSGDWYVMVPRRTSVTTASRYAGPISSRGSNDYAARAAVQAARAVAAFPYDVFPLRPP